MGIKLLYQQHSDQMMSLIVGYVFGILIDFFVVNRATKNLDLSETIYLFWCERKLYLILSVCSFLVVSWFYFKGQIVLPTDFKIDMSIFVIQGKLVSEFIVGFLSSYFFLILGKLKKPIQLDV